MDNAQLRFIFDREHRATETKKGLLQIEVRLTGSNKRRLISTGIHLTKNQFSDKNGFTCKNHPNALAITGQAASIFRKIESFVLSDNCKNLENVKFWNKEKGESFSVVEFIKSELNRNNPSFAVLQYHNSLMKRLIEFGKIKVFSDFTYENIVDFDAYLRKYIQSTPTLYKRHSALRRYIKEAINRGFCKYDPYLQFKLKRGKGKDPTFLEQSEIEKILNYNPANAKLQEVKDLFVFQMFTGLAYIDLYNFSRDYISEIDGMKVIRSNRQKTDESFISLFLPEAKRIAEKYNYQLPKFPNQKYNFYLKVLGAGAELKKSLTSHTARHTFATYLLNKNIPIESVSRALGHSTIKMTEHYAKMLGQKVVNDMKKLL